MAPPDEVSLIVFDAQVEHITAFSSQRTELLRALDAAATRDGTALLDALALALRHARKAAHQRRVIFLFSDGGDRDSRFGWTDLRRMVRESNVRIFGFMPEPWRANSRQDAALLEELAADSGGRCFFERHPQEISRDIERLELHAQYVLGYTPANYSRDGKYRRVNLKLEGVDGKLRACWRRGYYAPVE
jgi:VWFA-related protein